MNCRQHAACKDTKEDGTVVWNPDICDICDEIVSRIYDAPLPTPLIRKDLITKLRKWANGYRKNRPSSPFLISEKWRLALFRRTGKEFVWQPGSTTFHKIPLVTIATDGSEAASVQDEGEVPMEVENELLSENGSEGFLKDIGDDGEDSLSTVSTPNPSGDESEYELSDQEMEDQGTPRNKYEEQKQNLQDHSIVTDPQTGAISKAKAPRTLTSSPGFAPIQPATDQGEGSTPVPAHVPPSQPPLTNSADLLLAITRMNENMAQMSAQMAQSQHDILAAQESAKQQVAAVQAKAKRDLLAAQKQTAQVQADLAKAQAEAAKQAEIERSVLLSKQKSIEAELAKLKTAPVRSKLPPASSLPLCESSNPWIEGTRVAKTEDGYYVLPGIGVKHGDDLVFLPNKDEFPDVWIRLHKDLVEKDDIIINETLLYPHDKAQASYRRLIRKSNATSSQVGISGKKTSIYSAPKDMVFPYADKIFMAAKVAWREDKGKFPSLKEFDAVSMLCPTSTDDWKECAQTFKPCRLGNDAARTQLGENVHLIPIKNLKEEYEARLALAQALSTQSMLEFSVHLNNTAIKELKPVPGAEKTEESLRVAAEMSRLSAKQHIQQFATALFRFGEARRACRKAAFVSAKVRHEPERLINASIWGENLFPDNMVKEIREQAAKADKSLLSKWGMPSFGNKRRNSQGNMGYPAKRKKFNPRYTVLPYESPVYNSRYENRDTAFRPPGNKWRNRRSKGRGAKNTGGERGGHNSSRGGHGFRGNFRGNTNFRGNRGGRGGRGGHHSGNQPQHDSSAAPNSKSQNQSNQQ